VIAAEPKRFFLPAYIGARGYLGIRLDVRYVDCKGVAERIAASYQRAAPKRLVEKAKLNHVSVGTRKGTGRPPHRA
jgi:hypothetical protein